MAYPLRPHDLLRIAPPTWNDAPPWVEAALIRAPFAVVRRAAYQSGQIPIGVRGSSRGERFGTWLDTQHVLSTIRPEDLLAIEPQLEPQLELRRDLPAFALLRQIIPICNAAAITWGPTGSAGFELASGMPTITETSDLDLVIRMPSPMRETDAATLFDTLTQAAVAQHIRIDIQAETPNGAFALAEYARPHRTIMLRHIDGPRLVANPWHDDHETPRLPGIGQPVL
jgi:phosphoribosyl-dephospho-CoA transferase